MKGFSYDPDPKTKIIGLNIKNHNMDLAEDIMETVIHQCYDEAVHS